MRRWLIHWLQTFGAAVALLAGTWLVAAHCLGLQLLAVQTGSMCPTFCPGDALVLRRTTVGQVRPGMVVSYRSSRNPNELVTHRLVGDSRGSLQTKGDALSIPDPPVRDSLLVGQVVAVLPGVGRLLDDLRSWPGLVACVYLPALGLVCGELKRFERAWHRPRPYQLIRY